MGFRPVLVEHPACGAEHPLWVKGPVALMVDKDVGALTFQGMVRCGLDVLFVYAKKGG